MPIDYVCPQCGGYNFTEKAMRPTEQPVTVTREVGSDGAEYRAVDYEEFEWFDDVVRVESWECDTCDKTWDQGEDAWLASLVPWAGDAEPFEVIDEELPGAQPRLYFVVASADSGPSIEGRYLAPATVAGMAGFIWLRHHRHRALFPTFEDAVRAGRATVARYAEMMAKVEAGLATEQQAREQEALP